MTLAPGAAAPAVATPTSPAPLSAGIGHHYPGDSLHLGDRILRQGMSGHDVRVLQGYLTRAGFPTSVDGQFGAGTRADVVAFQRSKNLAPNGIVTWTVAQALRAAVGSSQALSTQNAPPAGRAQISNGLAIAPADAPASVRGVIAAANKIAFAPYTYAGGHRSFNASGYDCSGSVSFALHGGGLLSSPEDSSALESYGAGGRGHWITIWSTPAHAYMYVAGLRFDTSAQRSTGGSRWTIHGRSSAGYVDRHPYGL
jgi:peptidoglycan hydrolase-like protein with peptidoglycan-binding domain